MSFRDKEKRRGPIDKRTTIDAVHNNKIKEFMNEENSVNKLIKEQRKMEKEYQQLDLKMMIELSDEQLRRKLRLKDDITSHKKKIDKLQNRTDRTNYYLQAGDLVNQYYSNKDEKQYIEENTDNSIISLFKKNTPQDERPKDKVLDKQSISVINKYMGIMDDEFLCSEKEDRVEICKKCNLNMYLIPVESVLICKKCGETEDIIINSDKPSYKDPPREVSYFAYKRINHFNEWLAQFQAKESTEIPAEVYTKIVDELNRQKIYDYSKNLYPEKIREILKKLRYNKYYEHVPHIINHLNGVPAPSMNRMVEEKLRTMFKEIQTPFVKYCPSNRKNFLSYSYVLHKFCELLSLDEYLVCFPLLKSREKLQQQDNIWEKICHDLQWEYIAST